MNARCILCTFPSTGRYTDEHITIPGLRAHIAQAPSKINFDLAVVLDDGQIVTFLRKVFEPLMITEPILPTLLEKILSLGIIWTSRGNHRVRIGPERLKVQKKRARSRNT